MSTVWRQSAAPSPLSRALRQAFKVTGGNLHGLLRKRSAQVLDLLEAEISSGRKLIPRNPTTGHVRLEASLPSCPSHATPSGFSACRQVDRSFRSAKLSLFRPFSTQSPLGKFPNPVPLGHTSRRRWPRRLGFALLSAAMPLSGALLWIAVSEDPARSAKLLWAVPLRLGRDLVTAVATAADYHFSLRGLEPGSPEREEAKAACHLRGADRLQRLLFSNGGIYIKLGQHIGQLDYLLPSEYVQTMKRVMLDKCPTSSYNQVRAIFNAELGRPPEECFAEFDEKPFASASLAQVHVARLFDGQKVAVKVQHGHLTDTAAADTATVALVVRALYWLYPSFDYRWLVDEVRESLPQELDFTREASNALQCAANFESSDLRGRVAVPTVVPALSSRRVLTMEFMEGVGVTDVAAIERLGLRAADVAKLVSQTFAEMIFHHGFVHCDPHAANLLVRPAPRRGRGPPTPQLVLLDHGLYRTVSPYLRFHYASLWKALVFADVAQVKEHSIAMGAGEDLYILFAAVLTMRPWSRIQEPSLSHLMVSDTPETRAEIQANAAKFVNEVSELLSRLPRVVLLLLKTNDCLRSVDLALGAGVNTFVIIGRKCVRALADIQRARHPGPWTQIKASLGVWHAELRILSLQAAAWLARLRQRWNMWMGRDDSALALLAA